MRWVLVGREDAFEALRSGHLQQSLVRGQGLIIAAAVITLLATTYTTALALLAHLFAGATLPGEGAAEQIHVPIEANLSTKKASGKCR